MSILDVAVSSNQLQYPIFAQQGDLECDVLPDFSNKFRAFGRTHVIKAHGFLKRSSALTRHMRDLRLQRAQERDSSSELNGLRALRHTFNRRQLRHGDRVKLHFGRKRGLRIHPSQWTFAGSVLAAYKAIGAKESNKGLGKTRRSLEVTSAVTYCHNMANSVGLTKQCLDRALNTELNCLFVLRGFDCTPLAVTFGQLGTEVAPHARYFLKQDDGKWSAVGLEAFQAAHGRARNPSRGTMECLAQTLEVAWLDKDSIIGRAHQPIAPKFLQRGNASTMLTAINSALPDLSVESLARLAAKVRFVFLRMTPDMCPANTRLRAEFAERVKNVKNILTSPIPGCSVHMLHRIITHAVRETKLTGDVHASIVIHRNTHHQAKLESAVEAIISDDRFEFNEDDDPDPAWAKHLADILSMTTGSLVSVSNLASQ